MSNIVAYVVAIKEEKYDDESEECGDEETASAVWNHLLVLILRSLGVLAALIRNKYSEGDKHT